jgi:hypothetical protein
MYSNEDLGVTHTCLSSHASRVPQMRPWMARDGLNSGLNLLLDLSPLDVRPVVRCYLANTV